MTLPEHLAKRRPKDNGADALLKLTQNHPVLC
jgi:hypothetical protein